MTFLRLALLLLLLSFGVVLRAADLVDSTVRLPSVTLMDGRVFTDAEIRAFGTKSVMVRHRDGISQIPYELFPEELRAALLAKKPAAGPSPSLAPKTAAAAPTPPKAPAAARSSQPKGKLRYVVGRVYSLPRRGGWQAFAGVNVYAFDARDFRIYDEGRRASHSPEHQALRQRLNGAVLGARPTSEEIKTFFADEYASWTGMPKALDAFRTDNNGEFVLRVPVDLKIVVFARAREEGDGPGVFHVWAAAGEPAPVILNDSKKYPATSAEVPAFD